MWVLMVISIRPSSAKPCTQQPPHHIPFGSRSGLNGARIVLNDFDEAERNTAGGLCTAKDRSLWVYSSRTRPESGRVQAFVHRTSGLQQCKGYGAHSNRPR